MKTEVQESESMIAQLRKIRDQIDNETKDMTTEQVVAYFNQQKGLFPKSYWNKTGDLKQENN
ncbi:hypothetical protein [uncultured Mucilaginibacter sp.]|uniref:hypothetical protein n=1 Tax=uncultured Mucilaginibacter sp. TaxID=797541 RepID=UPI00262D7F31|nr:hypothetical protein [uncultured Mucilaginibacter sp.]